MRLTLAVFLSLTLASPMPAAERGKVTNLPIPRYVSLKAEKGNARRGPSLSHRIDWVFQRRNMPLEVTAEYGHWRRVQDRDGQGGWMHYSLLSGARHIIVEDDLTPLHAKPSTEAVIKAYAEAGVVARLGNCAPDWCKISANGIRGWVRKGQIWGVRPDELRE